MMCEPQVFGLRAGSSLAKLPSDGRAGGPRLGLDTSLLNIMFWLKYECGTTRRAGIYFFLHLFCGQSIFQDDFDKGFQKQFVFNCP